MSEKLWCAACGTWGDHQSGSCPTLKIHYIAKQLELRMPKCEGFSDFCDSAMCLECPYCEKNLKIEVMKIIGSCFNCQGQGITSGFLDITTSYTGICNRCGGTGKFSG